MEEKYYSFSKNTLAGFIAHITNNTMNHQIFKSIISGIILAIIRAPNIAAP